jgi:hypothetical protein
MPAAIVIAALILAGAIVHPDPAAGDLWTVSTLLVGLAVVGLIWRGDR